MLKNQENLTLKQQFRKHAVENKTSAFRVWKCRMRALGLQTDEKEYILNGYDNVSKR